MKRHRRQQHDASDSLASIPWYWRDWRASKARAVLTLEARAVYRELMDAQWAEADCALAPDDESLAALAAVPMETWLRVRAQVLAFFDTNREGKLVNQRVQFEWKKARALRRVRRKSAADAAKARWHKEKAGVQNESAAHASRIPNAGQPDALRHPSSVIRQPSSKKENAAAAAKPVWTRAGGEAYEQRFGVGSWTKGRAIRFNTAVKPTIDAYGQERVLPVWRWYVNRTSEHHKFLTPEAFVSGFLEWERESKQDAQPSRVVAAGALFVDKTRAEVQAEAKAEMEKEAARR